MTTMFAYAMEAGGRVALAHPAPREEIERQRIVKGWRPPEVERIDGEAEPETAARVAVAMAARPFADDAAFKVAMRAALVPAGAAAALEVTADDLPAARIEDWRIVKGKLVAVEPAPEPAPEGEAEL